jgi:hypothetical protein
MRVESTHDESTWHQRQPSHGSRKEIAFGAAEQELQHNNGMHPTGNSVDVTRILDASVNASRRVMPGVRCLLL